MKKYLFLAGFLTLISFVVFLFWFNTFRVTSYSPKKNSPELTPITITFNKNIDPASARKGVTITPFIDGDLLVEGKKITLLPYESLLISEYTVSLSNIKSKDGDTLNFNYSFKVSKQAKASQEQEEYAHGLSAAYQNPVAAALPFDDLAFRIELTPIDEDLGTPTNWKEKRNNYYITIYTYAWDDNPDRNDYINKSLTLRNQALEWLVEEAKIKETDLASVDIRFFPSDAALTP